jgi:hypothetical protein
MPQYPFVIGAQRAAQYYGVEVVDPTPDPPVNRTPPIISLVDPLADAVGDHVESTVGNWDNVPDSYAYRWQRDGTNIAGALGAANPYIIVAADEGTTLTNDVTATNVSGSATASSGNGIAIPTPP